MVESVALLEEVAIIAVAISRLLLTPVCLSFRSSGLSLRSWCLVVLLRLLLLVVQVVC